MSTSPRIAAKLLAAATAVAMSIALAPSASAQLGTCGGRSTYGGNSGPNTAAVMQRGGCNPFERIGNAFDRFFHIPDRDDQQLQQRRAAN